MVLMCLCTSVSVEQFPPLYSRTQRQLYSSSSAQLRSFFTVTFRQCIDTPCASTSVPCQGTMTLTRHRRPSRFLRRNAGQLLPFLSPTRSHLSHFYISQYLPAALSPLCKCITAPLCARSRLSIVSSPVVWCFSERQSLSSSLKHDWHLPSCGNAALDQDVKR